MHRENFAASSRVKLLYLVDGFLAMVDAENPFGLYAISRSMCELSAFLHEIQIRLQAIALQVTESSWQPLGEQFFGVLIRARFATTHPDHRAMLIAEGVSAARLKPFNIMHCIQGLAAEPEHIDVAERYALLCDFVHHNLGSSTLANSGSGVADAARSLSGGEMRHSSGEMTITQYEYPVADKAGLAVSALVSDFIRDTQACVQWLNLTPGGPFPTDMVVKATGNPIGFPQLRRR
ncbi:hypothetical protein BST36_25735 [Mycolicibacterium moriokaense]|nr:hypothetical protein BST36_25735 [Mycolicibacterium moriokaense]